MKRLAVILVLLLSLVLSACGAVSHSSTFHPLSGTGQASIPGISAQTKTVALNRVKRCFPSSEVAQLKLAEPIKGKAGREAVTACLKIPSGNRTTFDDELLAALLNGHLNTKAGRDALPGVVATLVVQNGG